MKLSLKDLKVTSFPTTERLEIKGGTRESYTPDKCWLTETAVGQVGCPTTNLDPEC